MTAPPRTATVFTSGAVAIGLAHLLLALTRFDSGANVVMACVNLFALWNGLQYWRTRGARAAGLFAAGYAGLALIFIAVARSPLLFAGFALLYTGCFRVPLLLGGTLILVFSVAVLTPYWIQTTLLLGLLFAVVWPLAPRRHSRFQLLSFGVGFILLGAILLPLLYLCFQITPQTLLVNLAEPQFRSALWTSLITSSISTAVIVLFGVPFAYGFARLDFWGKRLIDSLIDLPIVIPQSVAGIALLVLLGPKTPVGGFLRQHWGLDISGSYLGIIACQVFVSSPFLIRSAIHAFDEMGPAMENVSRTLGAPPLSTFLRVSLPLASGAIFNGAVLTWARAISECGSLMVVAYHPLSVSVYTYDVFVQYGLKEAQPAAVLLVIICLWGFLMLRWLHSVRLGPFFSAPRKQNS